jgi:hypothetical protein
MGSNRLAFARISPTGTVARAAATLRRLGALEVAALMLVGAALGTCAETALAAAPHAEPLGVVVAKDPSPSEPGPYIWARGGERVVVERVPVEGSQRVGGRARVSIEAPLSRVRRALLDVERWPQFMPGLVGARAVDTSRGGTLVELLAAPPGLGEVRALTRFVRSKDAGSETYVAELVGGDLEYLRASWILAPISKSATELTLELHVRPARDVDGAALDLANLEGTAEAAVALRRHAEARR